MGRTHGKVRCIIFDLDGTLIGGTSVWIPALMETLSHLGARASPAELRNELQTLPVDGDLWRRILRRRCPGREEHALPVFYEALRRGMEKAELSCRLRSFLQDIRPRGYRTAIVTFRSSESAGAALDKMEARDLFDVIVGFGDTEKAKPSSMPFLSVCERLGMKPEECMVVGDEPADILGANEAGMVSVGVLTGLSDRGRLERLKADFIIRSVEELPDLLANQTA